MNRLFRHLHTKSSEKKQRLFMELMLPGPATRVLNVGASGPHLGLAEQFETVYPYAGRITGGGIHFNEIEEYRDSFHTNAIVFDGCALPFRDKTFDIVYSNAVVEHLPTADHARRFAAEIQRVGKGWFETTPNFWYPVEPHYHLPFVQMLPEAAQKRVASALGKTPYSNLHLFTAGELRRLFPGGTVMGCRVTFYPETLISYKAA